MTAALDELNNKWRTEGHPYAVKSDCDWTMFCPSCTIAIGDGKISLVDALNRAIRHRRQGCSPVPA